MQAEQWLIHHLILDVVTRSHNDPVSQKLYIAQHNAGLISYCPLSTNNHSGKQLNFSSEKQGKKRKEMCLLIDSLRFQTRRMSTQAWACFSLDVPGLSYTHLTYFRAAKHHLYSKAVFTPSLSHHALKAERQQKQCERFGILQEVVLCWEKSTAMPGCWSTVNI